jgi:ABC-type Fe3+ transport system substrate-binding protein
MGNMGKKYKKNILTDKSSSDSGTAAVINSQTTNELVIFSQNSLQVKPKKEKPTMVIFPIDRGCLPCYITRAYGALVSHGANKVWAREKAREWKKMGHPRKVIPDILKYVNIKLETVKPFRYFAD